VNRKAFLKSACGLGVCGCVLSVLDPSEVLVATTAQAPDQRLALPQVDGRAARVARASQALASSFAEVFPGRCSRRNSGAR
jgi:hypothetical protein